MLKKHKNQLFAIVNEHKISPSWFEPSEKDQNFKLTLRGTPLAFEIENSPSSHNSFRYRAFMYRPKAFVRGLWVEGREKPDFFSAYLLNFEDITQAFSKWLDAEVIEYLQEQSSPNLWSDAANLSSTFESQSSPNSDYSRFSQEEREYVRQSVDRFKLLLIQEYSPDEEQMRVINEKLDYLKRAAERLNRFDWQSVAISTIIGIAINLSIDTSTGSRLWMLLRQAFGPIITLLTSGGA